MKELKYDLIILGSSTSGVCALIEASRNKLKVALIEEGNSIGGMLTSAGVCAFDGNNNICGGIFREFRDKLLQYYDKDFLDTGWVSNTLFEPEVGEKILLSMVDYDYADIFLSVKKVSFNKFIKTNLNIDSIEFDSNNEKYNITSKYYIFADEMGDMIHKLNLKTHYGLEADMDSPYQLSHPQDFTYNAILQFDGELKVVDEYPKWAFDCEFEGILGHPNPMPLSRMLEYGMLPNNKIMLNWPICGNDYFGNYFEEDRTLLFEKAKEKTLRLVKLIKTSVDPKCNLRLSDTSYPLSKDKLPYIAYIREARRIYGRDTLSLEDLKSDKIIKDAIAVGDYPLDHHRDLDKDYKKIKFDKIHPFSIPFGCLIPLNTNNILVVEKSISVTGLVNGTTRLQPVVMQLGQVASLAVIIALKKDIDIINVDIKELQNLILDKKGYLYPTHDVSIENPNFKKIQLKIRDGEIKLKYSRDGWVNKAYCNNN